MSVRPRIAAAFVPGIRRHPAAGPACAALLLLALSGCSDPSAPWMRHPRLENEGAPVADTPEHLLLRLKWAWEHQDCDVYGTLFTSDYRFIFAAVDSAANPPLSRDEELEIGRHLFVEGTATEPRARRITLTYASELVARPDRRPGKTAPWHQEILVRVLLTVETDDIVHQVDGKALFFVVRGDSAWFSPELRLRGFDPDPGRWYIEGWVDQTDAGAAAVTVRDAAVAAPAGAVSGGVRVDAARAAGPARDARPAPIRATGARRRIA